MLTFEGYVRDSVHGQIPYTGTEKKLIDTVQFRRLQNIKQQSTMNLTFSTAEHTRYSHSLGVMYIADRIAEQLRLPDDERQIIRIAALLHDIGHYPLSHICEFSYRTNLGEQPFLQETNKQVLKDIDKLADGKNKKIYYMKPARGLHHEKFGACIVFYREEIRKIIEEDPLIRTSSHKDRVFHIITDMIIGNVSRDTDPLFVQILHSEMDADGIDYVMRDAYFGGSTYGEFDVDQLISSMCIARTQTGNRILCIKPEGITAADSYLINKFNTYVNYNYDRNVVVTDWMVRQVMFWLQQDGKIFKSRTQMKEVARSADNEWYETFTDDAFWAIIIDIARGRYSNAPYMIVRICQWIQRHSALNLYVDKSEVKILSKDNTEIYKRLSGSTAYQELSANQGKFYYRKDPSLRYNRVALMNNREMTKQMPEEKFLRKLSETQADPSEVHSLEDRRLIECVTVWDEDTHDLHVLCDDERSLMRFLYDVEVYTLRLYELP